MSILFNQISKYQYVCFIIIMLHGFTSSASGQWTRHIIESNADYSNAFDAHDIDNDGDMDLFFAQEFVSRLVFYENNNRDPWTKTIIDNNAGAPVGVDLADLDNDGKMDIILGCFGADLVTWYKNDGGDPIEWIKDTINKSYDGTVFVQAADINGDGALDIVGRYFISGEMVWYENKLPMDWTPHLIHPKMPSYGYFDVGDVNNDDQPDIVRAYEQGNRVVLFTNNLPDPNWTEITVDNNIKTRCSLFGDIDADGDMDIVAGAHGSNRDDMDVAWYENDGSGINWTKHSIISNLSDATWIDLVDIDNNDTMDIVLKAEADNQIILLRNRDGGQHWTEYAVENQDEKLNHLYTHDIDLDGDFDLVFSTSEGGSLVWYENPLGSAYAVSFKSSPIWSPSQNDTLTISAEMFNPEDHPVMSHVVIKGNQSGFVDTLQLFDDGLHSDSDSADNIWANSRLLAGFPEDEFEVDLFTYDSTYGKTLGFLTPAHFITNGPVGYKGFNIVQNFPCGNTLPYPGACLSYKLLLQNNSTMADATHIKAKLSSLGTLASFTDSISGFESIAAGETSESEKKYKLLISEQCPVGTEVPIVVSISSYDNICWRDTFSITIVQDPTVNVRDTREPRVRVYPNPAADFIIIESAWTGSYSVDITSLSGQEIFYEETEESTHQLDLSSFPKGVYFITIKSKNFVSTKKVIKL